ncbi:MAG: hypothetical protein HOV66_00305 [Streptomycetaceae bacterium]|nr:hypothetical protein [Streptomycetaceae bacterium]
MTERTIAAEWAWHAKPGDTHGDYRVLRSSGPPADYPRFGAEIRARAIGTPLPAVRGPDALPWVRFDRSADGTANTVTWTEWSAFLDEFGRPIVGTSHYVLPGVDLALHRPALDELVQALFGIDLAEHPPQPALLTLPAPGEPRGRQPYPLGWLASVAALLLEGPVTLVPDAADWPMRDRVRVFDDILGLLPYPAAAAVSAATWWTASAAGSVRLAVGPAQRGRRAVRIGGPAEPETAAGAAYRRLVLGLAEARGAAPLSRDLRAFPMPSAPGPDPVRAEAVLGAVRARFGDSAG